MIEIKQIRYTNRIGDWQELYKDWDAFSQEQLDRWGQTDYNVCELLLADDLTQPCFDYDDKLSHEPTQEEIKNALGRCRDAIRQICKGDPRFNFDAHVLQASRHGQIAPGKWKVSWRFVIKNLYAIRWADMPKLLEECGSRDDAELWDKSIYSSRRLLAIPGGCKGGGDLRVLEMTDRTQAKHFLAQAPSPNAIELEFKDEPEFRKGRPLQEGGRVWEEALPLLLAAGFINPTPVGRRQMSITFTSDNRTDMTPCPLCSFIHERQCWYLMVDSDGKFATKNYSSRCYRRKLGQDKCLMREDLDDVTPLLDIAAAGRQIATTAERQAHLRMVQRLQPVVEGVMGGAIQVFTEDKGNRFQFHVQNAAFCALCRGFHGASLYDCECVLATCCWIKNRDSHCQQRVIGWKQVPAFTAIVENPTGDAPFAQLFMLQQQSVGFVWKHDGESFYRHDGVLWQPQTDVFFQKELQDAVRPMLKGLAKLIHNEAVDNDTKATKGHPDSDAMYAASKRLDRCSKVKDVMLESKTALHDAEFSKVVNSDPLLLGMNNGMMDLQSCTFRDSTPADVVSMSVNYDWPEIWDERVEAELEEFMRKVYPIEEERVLFQKVAGYSLLGRHPAKILVLLTDSRGGYNGKSTVLALLREAMGQYATKAEANLLYKTDHVRDINEHSSGLLAFEKIRLIVIEEADSSKALNSELLKDMNGGEAMMTGRPMFRWVKKEFPWISKTLIAFNEGKCPQFDVDDTALVERMLTIPHRSRFQFEESSEEFTYPADPDLKLKFREWRPYMLKFMLAGLRRYHQTGFRDIPASCQTFKQKLVEEKDVVREFLEQTVEIPEMRMTDKAATHEGVWVEVKELYDEFDRTHKAMQRDKKTKKDSKSFQAAVTRCVPDAFREKVQYVNKAGSRTCVRRVLLGVKRKSSE